MANNIYVVNRYVPVFANPVEWDNLREYEPLTIVTYQGTSYTSRKTVPVGTALSNTEYWVFTGNYNAQVEEYRAEVAQVASDLTTLSGTVSSNTSAINTLKSDKVDKVSNRKFLFVGDSYIASHSNTCVERACNILGISISNYSNISTSGASFHDGSFLTQITNYAGTKSDITDIFVIGGLNDSIYTTNDSTLTNAINSFFSYAKTNYPNATVSVCFAGHAHDNATLLDGRTWHKRCWANYMYENRVLANGGVYYGDMWQGLAVSTANMNDDGIHPANYGNEELANLLVSYILGAESKSLYPPFGLASGLSNFTYNIKDNNVQINYDASYYENTSVASQTIAGNGSVVITNNCRVYANKPFIMPCICRGVNVNSQSHMPLRGFLVLDGSTLSLVFNNITSSGFGNLQFASNGNVSIDKLQMNIPINNLQ